MKNFFLLCAVLAFSTIIFAQETTSFSLTKGTKLTYNVEQGTKEYQFIMKITELGESVSFDWEMTAPVNKSGSITMTADAMKNASALFNYFSGGKKTLTEETSAFLSREVYEILELSGQVALSVNGKNGTGEMFDVLKGMDSEKNGSMYLKFTKPVNGKDVTFDTYILENANGSNVIRVWKNEEFPLIIFMETDFKIYLTNIEQ